VVDRRFGNITKLRKERTTQTSQKNLSQSVAQKFQNLKFGEFFLKETGIAQEKKGCFVSVNCFWAKFHSVQPKKKALATTSSKVFLGKKMAHCHHTMRKNKSEVTIFREYRL
jgi:hypothetical protein